MFCLLVQCSVSSLGWFMSYQETSFVTIGQRLLANPLRYCCNVPFRCEKTNKMNYNKEK